MQVSVVRALNVVLVLIDQEIIYAKSTQKIQMNDVKIIYYS